jgi:hypothetical protein
MIFLKKWSLRSTMTSKSDGRRRSRARVEDRLAIVEPTLVEDNQSPPADPIDEYFRWEYDHGDSNGIRKDPYFYHIPLTILVSDLPIFTESLSKIYGNRWKELCLEFPVYILKRIRTFSATRTFARQRITINLDILRMKNLCGFMELMRRNLGAYSRQ